MQETRVQSLGWEDPLEEDMAPHSSVLTGKIPRSLVDCSPQGLKESDTTEHAHACAHAHTHTHRISNMTYEFVKNS